MYDLPAPWRKPGGYSGSERTALPERATRMLDEAMVWSTTPRRSSGSKSTPKVHVATPMGWAVALGCGFGLRLWAAALGCGFELRLLAAALTELQLQ
jgi:hypothetical protein